MSRWLVRSQVSKVDWRRKSKEWKREKEAPGGEVAQSWPPIGDNAQSANQVVL